MSMATRTFAESFACGSKGTGQQMHLHGSRGGQEWALYLVRMSGTAEGLHLQNFCVADAGWFRRGLGKGLDEGEGGWLERRRLVRCS